MAVITRTLTRNVRTSPNALELALLNHAQQLALEGWGNVADLVEQDGPAVGEREPPLAAAVGAGEGAALMTEQLAFQQRLRKRRAIHLDEGVLHAWRVIVDELGENLLAHAALATQQDRQVGGRHTARLVERGAQRGTLANDRLGVRGGDDAVAFARHRQGRAK